MDNLNLAVSYIMIFFSLYFEIFFLISYISKKKQKMPISATSPFTPGVTILIPCFNEEKSVVGTINSVLALDYPKEAMQIIVIDDGSTDNTYNQVLSHFKDNPIVEIYKKQNGGKFTALNFGIEKAKHNFIGSLDADSFVDSQSLKILINEFRDPVVMAAIPSTVIHEPKTFIQKTQRAEYNFSTFVRYCLSLINSVYVTPGPFSFFRKEVFEKLGNYKHAYNTEDMEMAMRMQKAGFKIAHAPKAVIYTICPDTVKKLYKQRVRWASGFLGNLNDYRHMFFKRKHGDLSILVLPFLTLGTFAILFFSSIFIIRLIENIYVTIERVSIVGFSFELKTLSISDWLYNQNTLTILALFTLGYAIISFAIGNKLTSGKARLDIELLYMIILYPLMYPIWIFKALYNTLLSKTAQWR